MRKGFTLIELLIVIAIIGLLATLAIVSLTSAQQKARDTKRIADIKQLQNAVELYNSQSGTSKYPNPLTGSVFTAWTGTADSTFEGLIGQFITNMPIDPTNSVADVYTYAVINTTFDQYVLKAKLEATNSALSGDDDTTYAIDTSSPFAADSYQGITSSDNVAAEADCDDANGLFYCVSD